LPERCTVPAPPPSPAISCIAVLIAFAHPRVAAATHQLVTTAAIFLAFKVSDIVVPLRQVLTVTYALFHGKHTDEVAKLFMEQDSIYRSLKGRVLQAERSLLYVIGFNFKPECPSKYFWPKINKTQAFPNLTDEQRATLKQICLNFSNDTLKTTLWLQYSAKELAYGFIYLTAKLSRFSLEATESGKEWFEQEGISVPRMREITNELLDLYETTGKGGKGSGKRSKSKSSGAAKKETPQQAVPGKDNIQLPAEPSMSIPVTPDLPPASPNQTADEVCKPKANSIEAQPRTAQV